MSNQKQKNKQKKSQMEIKLEKKCEQMQTQILENSFIIKSLQEKNSTLAIQNNQLQILNQHLQAKIKQELQKYSLSLDSFRFRINDLSCSKNELQIQNATLRAKLEYQHLQYEQYKKEKEKQIQDNKKHYQIQLGRLQAQYFQYQIAISQKQSLITEKNYLNNLIKGQRQVYKQNIADKERQKLQALDTIKKQSRQKMIEMKNNLLQIRKEQLSNNTRLILLQNNQLIQELQYQSSNTQKVLQKNKELQKKVHQLQNELQIQKQIQIQISRRSVMCKNMLKQYVNKNKEKQNEQNKKTITDIKQQGLQRLNNKQRQLIKIIQAQNKKIKELQKQLNIKNVQNADIKHQIDHIKSNANNLLFIIYQEYMQLLDNKYKEYQEFDLQKLKVTPITKWKKQDLSIIVQTIVNHLAQYIKKQHLDNQIWRNIVDRHLGTTLGNKQEIIYKNNEINKKYIKQFQLKRNKQSSAEARKLSVSLQGHRSLNRVTSDKSIPTSKYLQGQIREWGNEVSQKKHNLMNRFMKPIKYKLK